MHRALLSARMHLFMHGALLNAPCIIECTVQRIMHHALIYALLVMLLSRKDYSVSTLAGLRRTRYWRPSLLEGSYSPRRSRNPRVSRLRMTYWQRRFLSRAASATSPTLMNQTSVPRPCESPN